MRPYSRTPHLEALARFFPARNLVQWQARSNKAPPMRDLQCIVVTPERTVCDMRADFVALTLFDGEIGIEETLESERTQSF